MDRSNLLSTFAAWNNCDEDRLKSSSGGMFSAFAEKIIGKGGTVYAVAETEGGLVFLRAESIADIALMRGSKYYQAKAESLDTDVLYDDIKSAKPVLLVGTACHAGMFKNLIMARFKSIPDNVLIVDIICHGVGSKKYIDIYRKELENKNGRLIRHSFRNKLLGRLGSQYSEYRYESGNIVQTDNENDYYMRFFFPSFFLRPSCYECVYAGNKKESDITIGDFNGANRVVKEFPDSTHCISAVIVNSEKGGIFFSQLITEQSVSAIETDFETIASQNLPLLYPTIRPKVRNYAIKMIDMFGFITTCRLLGGKYYIRTAIKKIGGDRLLNSIKRKLGRTVIEH